jgi:hypothetical protein
MPGQPELHKETLSPKEGGGRGWHGSSSTVPDTKYKALSSNPNTTKKRKGGRKEKKGWEGGGSKGRSEEGKKTGWHIRRKTFYV